MSRLERLANVFRPNRLSEDLEREMASHLAEREQELIAAGRAPREARAEARRRFGNVTAQKEVARDYDVIGWLDDWATALARAWKSLKRTPGFLALGVASLGIALGLASTTLAEINSLTHPTVPIRDAANLYTISFWAGNPAQQKQITREVGLSLVLGSPLVDSAIVADRDTPFGAMLGGSGLMVPQDFFDFLGVTLTRGRVFLPADTGRPSVIATEESLSALERLGERPEVGKAMSVGALSAQLVGVLPPGLMRSLPYTLMPMGARPVSSPLYIVRVKPGVSRTEIERAVQTMGATLTGQLRQPGERDGVTAHATPMQPPSLGGRDLRLALTGAALFTLLIACANVSALMLARAAARRREQALKVALGASRASIIRDLVAEVAVIGLFGALAGLVLGNWTMRILTAAIPGEAWLMERNAFVAPHWHPRVFLELFALLIGTVSLATVLPALIATSVQPAEPLKDGAPSTTGRAAKRFQTLVVGELALAMVLLLGGTLMTKSAVRMATFDFGYDTRGLSRISGGPSGPQATAATVSDADRASVISALRAAPEIADAVWMTGAAAANGMIMSDEATATSGFFYTAGANLLRVGPDFIRVLGVQLLEGRDFAPGDDAGAGAVILDSIAAQRLFPNGGAVGREVKLGRKSSDVPWSRVIGVVRHPTFGLVTSGGGGEPTVLVSQPAPAAGAGWYTFAVREAPGVPDALPVGLGIVRSMLPNGASAAGYDWVQGYEAELMIRRLLAGMFLTLCVAALILAVAGLFGVLSYTVSQRLREFAVRVALGAHRRHLMRLVMRDGLVMALGGTAIGGLIGLGAAFALYDWLWGVYPVDAAALVIAESILLTVTITAAVIPALRASRANPLDIMRAT